MCLRILLVFIMILIFACAPNVRVTETYKSNQKKTEEVVKGEGSSAKIVKRIDYYSNGQIKAEAKITNKTVSYTHLTLPTKRIV